MLDMSRNYKDAIYAPIRQINARIHFTLYGTTKTYDDNTIINLNILEEMNTINETLPSNEIKVTLDNFNGEFNILRLQNMHEIIASLPKIEAEFGLIYADFPADILVSDFKGKIVGSNVENSNKAHHIFSSSLHPGNSDEWWELGLQSEFNSLKEVDGTNLYTITTNLNNTPQQKFAFDILRLLTEKFGEVIWQGKTTIADKVAIAQNYLKSCTCNWFGYGVAVGTKATLTNWNGTSWGSGVENTANGVELTQLIVDDPYIDEGGYMHFMVYGGPAKIRSSLYTDYVEIVLETEPIFLSEWVPMGTYFLSEWKNETAAMSISLIARDVFDLLSEVSYENTASSTLYNLAEDVLIKAGITDYVVDDSLKVITTAGFKERLDSRTALQHIGIAGRAAVYQDRNGTVVVKPFAHLDASSNYLTYVGQPYYFGQPYPLITDGFGMKLIDFENTFEPPDISLDKSIYEVVVKIYEGTSDREVVFINEAINGKNGTSFSIDNPLINTEYLARQVAEWIIRESNYNLIYKTNWRQNPALECADVILVEDSFDAKKQTRIYKQEFNYEGYLSGITESRGGI